MTEIAQHLFVVTGPESSGKSTLALWLSERLGSPLVPEVARSYLEESNEYGPDDLLAIALKQQQAERAALATGAATVIADTDQRTVQLWWAEKYPQLSPAPLATCVDQPDPSIKRIYLLCYPDLTWEPDPLRENPTDRARLFKLQLHELARDRAHFRVIWGEGTSRYTRSWYYVKQMLA